MGITFNEKNGVFHLFTEQTSYMILIHKDRYPLHLYWGKRVYDDDCAWVLDAAYRRRSLLLDREPDDPMFSLEYLPFEYPTYGTSDFRSPAFQVEDSKGDRICVPVYQSYEILEGKPEIPGLPSAYCEAGDHTETLVLTLWDEVLALEIKLYYSVLADYNAITRHTEFRKVSGEPIHLTRAYSVSMDMIHAPEELLHLAGTAIRETHIERRSLDNGFTGFESTRGISSHQQNPFAVLVNRDTGEFSGDAYGISLVYSGNFKMNAEVDMYQGARVQMGIHPLNFSWKLAEGETFETPEALLVYSDHGLNAMSQDYHRLLRERISRGAYRDQERPILLNTWEAFYFDFTQDDILELAKKAKKVGVELLVMDDGWFGKRDDSKSSLGDWYENPRKLPNGVKGLAEEINALGLKMGIWVEPEMISPDSDLYRAHPDWCIHVENRKRTQWRNQLVLDLSRDDVRDHILETLTHLFSSANIEYVKWDNNRRMTETGSVLLPADRKGEFFHRYIKNLYYILEQLTKRFPQILFENCASGGARFDPGMMHYFSQNWASDNTDPVCRLKIQHGASMVYPPIWITSHVSASPNHQTLRATPLPFREMVSQPFNLGYELDLLKLNEEELTEISEQIKRYKKLRKFVQFGTFTRLKSPFEGKGDAAWQVSDADGSEVMVWYYKPFVEPEEAYITVHPAGLDPRGQYRLMGGAEGKVYNGSILMQMGLKLDWYNGDFFCQKWHFKKI